VSNIENWKRREDRGVFSLVTTFTDGFRFIAKNGVDLQQDHQGARVWKNAIIPSLRGSTLRWTHTSWGSGSSSRGHYVNLKFKDVSRAGSSFTYVVWSP